MAPEPLPLPELLTTDEVADFLGLTKEGVAGMLRTKRLPGVKVGHRWYVNRRRLEQMLDPGPTSVGT